MSHERSKQRSMYHFLIVAMLASIPLQAILGGESPVLRAFWIGLPFAAALTMARGGRRRLAGVVLAVVAAGVAIAEGEVLSAFAFAAAFGFTTVVLLVRVFMHRVVTGATISGALCVYLLIGVTFAMVFSGLLHVDPAAFRGTDVDGAMQDQMAYFSFVTLTTLGYGDISPANEVARSFVILEALLGQLYMVAVVARLVGLSVSPVPADRT